MQADGSGNRSVARIQSFIAAGMVAVVVATTGLLYWVAHSRPIEQWVMRTDQEIARKDKKLYDYQHCFVDFEDRLINEEWPSVDYSKGGVYLFGPSGLKWSTRFWELPEEQRALIHNYGTASTNHGFQFQVVRYLVDHAGMLEAGGEKTMTIFGISYHSVGTKRLATEFFPNLWVRHGLFRYSLDEGISPVEVNPVWRKIHFERVRMGGCPMEILSTLAHKVGYHAALRVHNPDQYNLRRAEWLGPQWQEKMRVQLAEFEAMADYLMALKVRVVVVLMPQGTWEDNLPFERTYVQKMKEICRRKSIPIYDWSKLLSDDEFADSGHPNLYGMDKLQPAFLDIALPFLRSTKALGGGEPFSAAAAAHQDISH